ncbi:MAG TPA: S8 family serine peptidase [Abditibacteriaceae bacterium]|jgi:subtilisin family serine protease
MTKKFSKNFCTNIVCGAAALAALGSTRVGQAQTPETTFFYSGGKRHPLVVSKRWTVLQLAPGASAPAVASAAKARAGVEAGGTTRTLASRSKGLVLVPLQQARTGESASDVRRAAKASLRTVPGVRGVRRAFGNAETPIVETDQIVVQFRAGVNAREVLTKYGVSIVRPLGSFAPNGFVGVVQNPDARGAVETANAIYENESVIFSHANLIRPKKKRFVPNDPLYSQQWHLNNTGQGGGKAGADIKAQLAWDITRGSSNVIIAIIDDGVDVNHEDLRDKIVAGYDVVDGDSDPRPFGTTDSHGTACAGVAAGTGNNALGVSGAAPNARIMPIRLLGNSAAGESTAGDTEEAEALRFAVDNGASIINNSWGPSDAEAVNGEWWLPHEATPAPLPDVVKAAIDYATTSGRGGKGCVVLWAAGNGNESADADGYASYSRNITVAASTNKDLHSNYSDFGTSVDVSAPSDWGPDGSVPDAGTLGITTTDNTGTNGDSTGNYYNAFGGTSSATPLTSGVVALMLSARPDLTRTQVQQILQSTADKIDPSGLYPYNSSGHSTRFGYGRINALKAVQGAINAPGGTAPTISSFTPSIGKIGTKVTINGTNFTGATAVRFNGISATSPTITATSISAFVPTGATTGAISVTTPGGTATSTTSFIVDTVAPTISIASPVNGSFVRALPTTFTGSVNDNNGIARVNRVIWYLRRPLGTGFEYWNAATQVWGATVVANTSTPARPGTSTTWSSVGALPTGANLTDGAYTVLAYAYDTAGNSGNTTRAFTLDRVLPTITINTPIKSSIVSAIPNMTGSVNDNNGIARVSRVIWYLRRPLGTGFEYWNAATQVWGATVVANTSTPARPSTNTSWGSVGAMPSGANLANGAYTALAYAYDAAGNSGSTTNTFTVQRTGLPTVAISSPAANATLTSLATATGTATDSDGISEVYAYLGRYTGTTLTHYYNWSTRRWTTNGGETGVDVLATGTSNWSLKMPPLEAGKYALAVAAYDNAAPQNASATVTHIFTTTKVPHDNFAAAYAIGGSSGRVGLGNRGATRETGEPNHGGEGGITSVWYSWTPTASGSVTFTTAGSSFDTLLGIYTGTSVGATTQRAFNDDESATLSTSKATFTAVAGTNYRIAVDGYNGATGDILLAWTQTVAGGSEATISEPQTAETSSVRLSSASALVRGAQITLQFTGALEAATAGDPSRYAVTVNGQSVDVSSAAYADSRVTLWLDEGVLTAGAAVQVAWRVRDSKGLSCIGKTDTVVAK